MSRADRNRGSGVGGGGCLQQSIHPVSSIPHSFHLFVRISPSVSPDSELSPVVQLTTKLIPMLFALLVIIENFLLLYSYRTFTHTRPIFVIADSYLFIVSPYIWFSVIIICGIKECITAIKYTQKITAKQNHSKRKLLKKIGKR